MKKSNQLLLGGFLLALLLITAIHVTLYAKYKAGNYTIFNSEAELDLPAMQSFPNILFVSVRNVSGPVVKFGQVAEVEKTEDTDIQYVQKGDTLVITGKDGADQSEFRKNLLFHVPFNAKLTVVNSRISFEGSKETQQSNTDIALHNSEAYFSDDRKTPQYGNMKLSLSDSSVATFGSNISFNDFAVQLSQSTIDAKRARFGRLSIATDSASTLSFHTKDLLKATITNNTPN